MACQSKDAMIKDLTNRAIRDIKSNNPKMPASEIRTNAAKVANAIVEKAFALAEFTDKTSIIAKGTVLAHVSDEDFDTIKTAKDGTSGLGLHIGTEDVVADYAEQAYGRKNETKDLTLYTVEVTEDLNAIELTDHVSDWTGYNMADQVLAQHPDSKITTDSTNAQIIDELKALGYNSIVYKNKGEGKLKDRKNSIIVLDKDTVKITKKTPTNVNIIKDTLAEERVQLGNTADSLVRDWTKFDEIRENVNDSIAGMKDLMYELHELGGKKETKTHLKHLGSLFDEMQEEFFNNLKVFINKKAEVTDGIVINKNIGIKVKPGPKELMNQMSEAEVYTHEIIHAMTTFAFRSGSKEASKIKRQLRYVMRQTLSEMTVEDLMPEVSVDEEAEYKLAKEMLDYVFSSENAEEEFMAHALTNPIFMEKLKDIKLAHKSETETVWEKIRDLMSTLLELLSGNFDFKDRGLTAYEQTHNLVFELAEINNRKIVERNNKINVASQIWDGIQKYNVKTSETVAEFWDKYVDKKKYEKPPEDPKARALWVAKMLFKMLTNNEYRKALELILSGFGLKPTGDFQTIFRDFFKNDELTDEVDALALLSDKIDSAKNTIVNAVIKLTHQGFSRTLTEEEEIALTRVILDTDISSIANKFDRKTLSKLLRDPAELARRISRAKHKLEKVDETNYNWNSTQAMGLGYFMATGKGHIAQNHNAQNIVQGRLSGKLRKPNYKAKHLVDEIATLVAIQNTPAAQKATVANLLKTERNGIENIIKMHEEFKRDSLKKVFGNSTANMIKGYSREIFDDQVSVMIASVNKEKELLDEGYIKKYDLKPSEHLKQDEPMAVYVADAFETSEIYRTATRMTAIKSRGTSIRAGVYESTNLTEAEKALKAKSNLNDIKEKMSEIVEQIIDGTVNLEDIQTGLMPVLDEDGIVTDYRYLMPKDTKEELLRQNVKVSEVMGKSFSSIIDKQESYTQNENVLDMILDDMEQNYISGSNIGSNNKEYITISKDSTDPEVQDLYSRLPKIFKDAMKLQASNKIAVRADLFHSYFGYRHISITNNKLIKKITPAVMLRLIRLAEQMWMEFIKITKVDILLKMPVVIVGNLVSNFMYGVMTGTDPLTLVKMYLDSSRDVSEYFKLHSELTDLKLAKKTGNINKLDLRRIPMVERQMQSNPIHELAELGIYQSIVEDLDTREMESTNKLKRKVDKQLDKMPTIVKQGANIMYLTQDTAYYKIMNEVLTKSDLIARDIENRKLRAIQEKQATGKMPLPKWFVMRGRDKIQNAKYAKTTKRLAGSELKEFNALADKRRHAAVLTAFVNYNRPSGRMEEYLNRIGMIMFTKYFKRIQKVMTETAKKNPLNVLAILLGEEMFGDVDTIYDQNILTKSWYNFGLSSNDFIPGTDPFERIMEVINPPLIQLLTDPKVF